MIKDPSPPSAVKAHVEPEKEIAPINYFRNTMNSALIYTGGLSTALGK